MVEDRLAKTRYSDLLEEWPGKPIKRKYKNTNFE